MAQVPLCVLAFIAVTVVLDLSVEEDSDWKQKLGRIDFLGAIVLVGAVLGFLLGLDRGSNVSWAMPMTIVSLSVSAALFVLFILIEVYYAPEPFAPGHIIFGGRFFASYGCNFFSFGGWLAALFYIPLYFQAVEGVSATVAGLWLLPSIFAGVTGSLFAGFVMKWTGRYYWLTVCAYALLTAGVFMIYLFSGALASNTVCIILGMVAAAFGNGIGVTSTLISLSASRPQFHRQSTNIISIKRNPRRPGRCNCLLVSLSVYGLGNRPLPLVHSGPAAPPEPAAGCSA